MTKTQKTSTPAIEIKRHPRHPETHARVVVTTKRGLCYFADWADEGQGVSTESALKSWQEDRKSFLPYYGY